MVDATSRLEAIQEEFIKALTTLESVVAYVTETKPNPALKVVILNNVIVALISTVEEGVRNLFEEYLAILEEVVDTYPGLHSDLKKANFNCAIQSLKKHKNSADFSDAVGLVKELSKCLRGETGYRLLKKELVYNQGNFRSSQMTEIAKNVGIQGIWRHICDCPEIEEYTAEQNREARVTKLAQAWNEIFDERDLIVHRISQASGWGDDRIRQAMGLCRLIVGRVQVCLAQDAMALVQQWTLRSAADLAG